MIFSISLIHFKSIDVLIYQKKGIQLMASWQELVFLVRIFIIIFIVRAIEPLQTYAIEFHLKWVAFGVKQ